MSKALKIAVVAGEASGDILGAGLITEILKYKPDTQFAGIGGDRMIEAGFTSRVPMERLSVMGISEVVGRLPELLRIRRQLYQWSCEWQPDLFIGIDAPDFNLGLEARLKASGIKTMHYVSPSVWAWRKGRLKKIRRAVDHMLTLLPFETDFYRDAGIPATLVGHTLADQLPMDADQSAAREMFNLKSQDRVIAMLPGSRGSEVGRLTPLFLSALARVQQQLGVIKILIPAANQARKQQVKDLLAELKPDLDIQLIDQHAETCITASDAVLVASGTATLQTMLLKRPMVVAYQMANFSYWLIRKLATTSWASLPNVLEQKDWVPERLQDDATPDVLANDVIRMLVDDAYRESFVERARYWHHQLALGADKQAARAVLSLLDCA